MAQMHVVRRKAPSTDQEKPCEVLLYCWNGRDVMKRFSGPFVDERLFEVRTFSTAVGSHESIAPRRRTRVCRGVINGMHRVRWHHTRAETTVCENSFVDLPHRYAELRCNFLRLRLREPHVHNAPRVFLRCATNRRVIARACAASGSIRVTPSIVEVISVDILRAEPRRVSQHNLVQQILPETLVAVVPCTTQKSWVRINQLAPP